MCHFNGAFLKEDLSNTFFFNASYSISCDPNVHLSFIVVLLSATGVQEDEITVLRDTFL